MSLKEKEKLLFGVQQRPSNKTTVSVGRLEESGNVLVLSIRLLVCACLFIRVLPC